VTAARFLALGDSYTIGEGVAPTERWPTLLAARLRDDGPPIEDPQIIARTGWTTDELSAAIDEAKPRGPFDLVTLLIGVNDQYRGRPVEQYRPAFRALLERAIGFAAGRPNHVIVLSIPDWGVTPFARGRDAVAIAHQIDDYNAANSDEARRRLVPYVDVTTSSRKAADRPDFVAADGLHPSPRLHREFAALTWVTAQRRLSR
jgi:lysophospholipase L1-like esterase